MNAQRKQELAIRGLIRVAAAFGARPNDDELDELAQLHVPAAAIAWVQRLADAAAEAHAERRPALGEAQRTADLLAHEVADSITPTEPDDDLDIDAMIDRQRLHGGARADSTAHSPQRAPWSAPL